MTDSPSAQPATAAKPADADTFTAEVNAVLADFLREQHEVVAGISPHAAELVASIQDLVRGGKRMRPRFAFWGFVGAGGDPTSEVVVRAGASLELFQAAALIHDDLIDRSDTRRGRPSVHKRFESIHERNGWDRVASRFGEAASVLAGDLCLSYSEQMFAGIPGEHRSARAVFDRMRTQVMAGQYLDVLEESAGRSYGAGNALDRARTILTYKSAKYSTENPLLIGGALAEAAGDLLDGYTEFALPLGKAFQLRDDVLGVFGDPVETGKPAGDDLREGKRTELVAHALLLAQPEDGSFIQARLGSAELGVADIDRMRSIIGSCGALAATEAAIDELSDSAFEALDRLPIEASVRDALHGLGLDAIARRA
ncbi:polyprenyl synthetase family protein [Arthrobacter sp. KK5.5]|uniref:polyprenyl synthetase family protein n=1 Tax=Arthrobacter sp. KK5.5 TaxID=3373084 RepID=UPI003EE5C9EC